MGFWGHSGLTFYLAPTGHGPEQLPSHAYSSGALTVPLEEPPGSSLPSDTSDEIMDLLVQSVTKSSPVP